MFQRFIVVCPSSLVTNWGKEFDKWLGKASQPKRVIVKKGGEEGLKTIRSFVPLKPHKSEGELYSVDLDYIKLRIDAYLYCCKSIKKRTEFILSVCSEFNLYTFVFTFTNVSSSTLKYIIDILSR